MILIQHEIIQLHNALKYQVQISMMACKETHCLEHAIVILKQEYSGKLTSGRTRFT